MNEKPLNSSESSQNEIISSNENSNDSLEELIKGLSLNPAENINEEKKIIENKIEINNFDSKGKEKNINPNNIPPL